MIFLFPEFLDEEKLKKIIENIKHLEKIPLVPLQEPKLIFWFWPRELLVIIISPWLFSIMRQD